jgi:hypothetical protein
MNRNMPFRAFPRTALLAGLSATLLLIGVGVSIPALAQSPPCNPCGGVRTADPVAVAAALATAPLLEGEDRLYVNWTVELTALEAVEAQAAAVRDAGGTPWLTLVFRTPSPVLDHIAALDVELKAAAAAARAVGPRGHFQVRWQPPALPQDLAFGKEYGYLLKRASVAITGARGDARVLTDALTADPRVLEILYGEEIAAYVDGVALRPGGAEPVRETLALLRQLDPGRAAVLDARPWPEAADGVLPEAAAASEAGFALTLFDLSDATPSDLAAALAPLKILAREFQGDVSLDPTSRPTGGAEAAENAGAWSFVRGEDLSLRVIAQVPASAETLDLRFPDAQLKRPAVIDTATGEVRDLFGQKRSADALEVSLTPSGTVALLRLERMTPEEIDGLAGVTEAVEVSDQRQMPVEEILRRLQAFEDGQTRRLRHYQAHNTTHLRFQFGTSVQALEATFAGDFFFRQGEGFDWAWNEFYVNGVRWRSKKIPEIPLVDAEKAAAQPLEITFTKEYTYRLRGTDTVAGRDCWVVDFAPSPGATGDNLYQGTVWVDREHFGRVRTRALQVGLEGEVVSNEETVEFTPVNAAGEVADWSPDNYWLPLRVVGQQLWNVLNATTVVEREVQLTALVLNGETFAERRQAVLDSDVTMVRDTPDGLRYLIPDEDTGERIVQTERRKSRLFGVGGVFYDESQDFPIPLAGINYFNFDFRDTGKQVNVFFAGPLLIGNLSDPDLFGSKWDAGINVFALALGGSDTVFRGDDEIEAEEVERLPARISLFLGRRLGNFGKLDLTYTAAWSGFDTADNTAPEFVLPEDHLTHTFQVEGLYNRAGYRLLAGTSFNNRSDWAPWGIPGTADFDNFDPETEDFQLWNLSLAKTWWLPKFQKMGLEVEYRDGTDLDRFSKYEFGYFSDVRVHGYTSDKVRAERAIATHLLYGFDLGEALRLSLIGDAAWATDEATGLDNEFLAGIGIEGSFIGPWNTIVNVDLGRAVAGPDDSFSVFVAFLKLFR